MLRLVETYFAPARESDVGDRSPPRLLHVRTVNSLLAEFGYFRLQIVAHEIELVPIRLLGWMNRDLRGRQGKNQPSVTGVHGWKSEHLSKKSAIRIRVLTEDHNMRAKQRLFLPLSTTIVQ